MDLTSGRFASLMDCRTPRILFFAAAVLLVDPATGRAAANDSATGTVIALPPFLVEQSTHGWPWRYAEMPGFEILARCSDSATRDYSLSYYRLQRVLELVLPLRFQVKLDVPRVLIFYDEGLLPATAQELFAEMDRRHASEGLHYPAAEAEPAHYEILRDPGLSDTDERETFVSVPAVSGHFDLEFGSPGSANLGLPFARPGFNSNQLIFTTSYAAYLVGNRTPPLPSWFVSGFLGLYAQMKFKDDTITLAPTVWGSETETRRIQRGKRSGDPVKITLLPMSEFLAGRAITEEPRDAARIHLWFAQAELFIRWALEEHEDARHAAFWKFLDRSCTEPVTEVMFRECFGAGFYEISDKLKFFVSTAISQTTTWRSAETMEDPPLELRNATGGEIARIKGEWERLEASYVRARSPVREAYLNLGRRTLRHAYDLGDRDPRLLASLGLLECDAGNEAGAREFLEPAVQGGVIRPRAYLELARLYFNTARTQPAGADDKFSADQAAAILAPLAAGGRQAPPLLETYQLIADVWAHCAAAPPPNEMATLEEGMKFFPKQAKLRQRIAELQASPPANNSGR